jgi:hypothetical protein
MNNYTFILEYRKGTYISQFMAETINDAMTKWASSIDHNTIPNFLVNDKKLLMKEVKKEENIPMLIKNIANVWCFFFIVRRSSLLLNIVLTKV